MMMLLMLLILLVESLMKLGVVAVLRLVGLCGEGGMKSGTVIGGTREVVLVLMVVVVGQSACLDAGLSVAMGIVVALGCEGVGAFRPFACCPVVCV
jgi:hypothetical protein